MRSRKWLFACLVVLLVATAALADGRSGPLGERKAFEPKLPAGATAARILRADLLKGEVPPLLFELPGVTGKTVIVSVMAGEKALVRETIEISADAIGSTVRLMTHQGKELEQLRRLEAKQPGTFVIVATMDGLELAKRPFGEADARGAQLFASKTPVVGATRMIEVSLAVKSNVAANGMQPDPECEQRCYDDYVFCVEYICDQRAGCYQCNQWYNDCIYSCPWVCVDPKDVDTFERTVYLGSTFYGTHCETDPRDWEDYYFDVWLSHYRQETVRRTEYCDGSYSDEVIDSYEFSVWCHVKWWPDWPCIIPEGWAQQICY